MGVERYNFTERLNTYSEKRKHDIVHIKQQEQSRAAWLRQIDQERKQSEAEKSEKLRSRWEKLDKAPLYAGRLAIQQIPVEMAQFLKTQKVRYDIWPVFAPSVHPFRMFSGGLWGRYDTRTEITTTKTISNSYRAEYESISYEKGTGIFRVTGWGINKRGTEFDFSGREPTLIGKRATPHYHCSSLASESLSQPSDQLMRTVLKVASQGEDAIDEYVTAEYEKAGAFYASFAENRIDSNTK